jgi:hypothetical protein
MGSKKTSFESLKTERSQGSAPFFSVVDNTAQIVPPISVQKGPPKEIEKKEASHRPGLQH